MARTDCTPAATGPKRHSPRGTTSIRKQRPTTPSRATVPVVAIGDVHGCASLLEKVLEMHRGSGAELIFLGDLIDRAPEPGGDRKVLEQIWALQQNPQYWGLAKVLVLRGNHEQMLLDALKEPTPGFATALWVFNGGCPELLPFFRGKQEWLEKLPYTAIRGNYLFVHAGVRPGIPLESQKSEDLLWIRKPFLDFSHGLPYTVVHGHSITKHHRIERRPGRINLDTGAFRSGILSSLTFKILANNRSGVLDH